MKLGNKRIGASEVANEIRNLIVSAELADRERLPSERALCETYGVSRGTIRDALLKLERDGLVEIRPSSGTYVSYNDKSGADEIIREARPLELIDTRFALEPHICRLAVLNARRPDFALMEELMDTMERNADNRRVFSEADTAFHQALVKSTGNSLLIWIIGQINDVRAQDQWARMRRVTLETRIIRTYNTQHRLIFEAIKNRDPERAAMLMKDHLETARQSLTRAADA